MLDMSRVPVKSKQPPPPRALKLPTISAAAMQALANRATMVSVDEVVFPHAPPVDGARGQPRYPPLSPAAYLRGVTAIATYRAYFFPGAAIQWLSYVLWLQGQAGDLPTSALRDIDVKARTHIARYHMEYQDPASLTEAIGQALAAPAVYAPAPAPDELTDEINEMMVLQSPTFCTHEKWSSFLELQKACANTLGLPTAALHWTTDIWFGLQRVQGVNAKLITLCTTIPRNFGVSASMVDPFLEGLTLGEALAANKIFIVDLHILEGILPEERVRPTDYLKQLCAPIALFYLNKHNVLLPIAIQLYQYSGKRNPVFLPSDPANLWLLAKMYFNCSEAQHHTVLTHMGLGRLLMEGVAVCTQRNLSPSHPLHRLLAPHFRHLMITNAVTVEELLEPGMWMYEFMMLKGAGVQELMRRGKASWRLDLDGVVPRQVAARGVAEPSVLPHYPYRDDATALHAAIERYVRACLEPYYTDETRVAGDWELLQWRRELVRPAQKGGLGLRGVPGDMVAGFTTLDHVVETATAFISAVTVGHAAATLGLYEEAGFVPGYPLVLHGLPPRSKEQTPSTAELLERLPGRCHTWFIMLLWKLFSSPRAPRLADPRHRWLLDPASTEAAARLRKELEELSRKIARRNATVPFPYQWLDPRLALPNCVPRAVVSKKADY
ncbi:Allene oxide synthase-lipoxygenase protein [Amphibalanus amphitrite]|uniref:Allene oxide synthase-lipoxygenase protein n=1 Tax=Amphibalanus amphitrite TaxID=1232801 RepID=A0A6A4WZR9_AMPAM|nr:Allene oxide synthase-lipoxygenase protein [Amphibalanus amphitrite]